MSKSGNVCFYPQLSDEMNESIFDSVNSSISFSYKVNEEINNIEFLDNNDNISFDDSTNWNCDDFKLHVSIQINLKNLNILFGKNGIAPSRAKIGLCVEWFSAQAKIRKVILSNELIVNTDNEKSYTFDFDFQEKTFEGSISLNVLLYLAKPADSILDEEKILNNNSGVIIGYIMRKVVFMTGDGSMFPIKTQSLPESNFLWELNLKVDEPGSRQVSDGVSLILNTAHKDYKLIDPNSKFYCDRLADEIVTNALALFLARLRQSGEFDLNGTYEEGTMLSYAQYCKNRLDVNFEDFLSIFNSLHEFSEKGE